MTGFSQSFIFARTKSITRVDIITLMIYDNEKFIETETNQIGGSV